MKKQTSVTALVLALLFLAVAKVQLVDVGFVYAQHPTEDMGKALHEAFQKSKPYLLQQMGISPPNVTILSIAENQTFTTSNITLSFRVMMSVKTEDFAYRLDGQENKTIEGNTTLTELHVGSHSIVVYATDMFGRFGDSETVNFTMAPQEEPEFVAVTAEPFPSMHSVVIGFCVVLGVSISIVHLKKGRSN